MNTTKVPEAVATNKYQFRGNMKTYLIFQVGRNFGNLGVTPLYRRADAKRLLAPSPYPSQHAATSRF
jgi:hypothetical protein